MRFSRSREQWIEYARGQALAFSGGVLHEPSRTIHVNPLEVTRVCRRHIITKKKEGSKLHDFGRVLGGDWDLLNQGRRNIPLEETVIHQSVFGRYANNFSWENLPVFEHKLKAIREQGKVDGCRSRAELVERYRRLDGVYEQLRETGWQLEERVGGLFQSNVSVSITRTGGFLLGTGGAHRLAIAKFLRLPTIEVYVLSRHTDWVAVRRRAADGQGFPHPDLEEFFEDTEQPPPAPAPPIARTTIHGFLNRMLPSRAS